MKDLADVRAFYASSAAMSDPGRHRDRFAALPDGVGELATVVQGLAIHEYMANAYGVQVPVARRFETHLRRVEAMVDRILEIDPRPLHEARAPELRLVGVCHHHALLLVSMLRAKGVPARMRGGFGAYFNPPYYEDHYLCEYWNATEGRWTLADPQFDAVWRRQLHITHDVLDVPRDRFLVSGEAWSRCRAGRADASRFGIFKGDMRGLWFIAGNLVRDIAALNRDEVLPWDVWGAMPPPDAQMSSEQLSVFDELAAMSRDPDGSFDVLRRRHAADERIRLPAVVHNAMREQDEAV